MNSEVEELESVAAEAEELRVAAKRLSVRARDALGVNRHDAMQMIGIVEAIDSLLGRIDKGIRRVTRNEPH